MINILAWGTEDQLRNVENKLIFLFKTKLIILFVEYCEKKEIFSLCGVLWEETNFSVEVEYAVTLQCNFAFAFQV